MIGIYTITSPSGKIYVGQSWNVDRRFQTYRKLKCKGQKLLYRSLLKYGPCAHVFAYLSELPEITTREQLDKWEKDIIASYRKKGCTLLNLTDGGIGSPGLKHTEEAKLKMSRLRKGLLVGKRNGRAREIVQLNNHGKALNVFSTITGAAQFINGNRLSISDCVNGRNKTSGGFVWRYKPVFNTPLVKDKLYSELTSQAINYNLFRFGL